MSNIHYSKERASSYERHHKKSLRNRLTSWREQRCLHAALRHGAPYGTVLDLPCGAGRFTESLDGIEVSRVIAADNSPGMLDEAKKALARTNYDHEVLLIDAFDIDLPDDAVDFVACMRFFHHVAMAEDRAKALAELRRITTGYLAISLWVDGNLGAFNRKRKTQAPLTPGFGKRRVISRALIEAEFRQAGFEIVRHWDMWPGITMWRQYLLKVGPK